MPSTSALTENLRCDVCLIGAGISGLSVAYHLACDGVSVIVLEDGEIGGGETSRTTAHLASAQDDRFFHLERIHGAKGARLAAASHAAAIDRIEEICKTEEIDCDFLRLDGYLFEPKLGKGANIRREFEAAQRAGLKGLELVNQAPLPFETGLSLKFPNQGQFHPIKYLRGLAEAVLKRGGKIFTHTHVTETQDGKPCVIKTRAGVKVTAKTIVVATNTPINDRFVIHTKQAPYRSYVVGVEVPKNSITSALFWDDADPYHYVRLQKAADDVQSADDLLIVGGEDHKTGQQQDYSAPFGRLEKWTRERFPMAAKIIYRWSGQVMEPVDGLAYIGRNPGSENTYISTGDSGQGMTHGTIAGLLISDLIAGRPNEWSTLYDPGRKSVMSMGAFTKENVNVAVQYADLVTSGEVGSASEIEPNHGAVLREGAWKYAVYKNPSGVLHKMSAACPHLGCIVRWNDVEKTWDCPCHGSRFDCYGKVVNGPANTNLENA